MTLFARAGWWVGRGARGLTVCGGAAPKSRSSLSSEARAIVPRPTALWPKKCRRVCNSSEPLSFIKAVLNQNGHKKHKRAQKAGRGLTRLGRDCSPLPRRSHILCSSSFLCLFVFFVAIAFVGYSRVMNSSRL